MAIGDTDIAGHNCSFEEEVVDPQFELELQSGTKYLFLDSDVGRIDLPCIANRIEEYLCGFREDFAVLRLGVRLKKFQNRYKK